MSTSRRHILTLLPLAAASGLGLGFYKMLTNLQKGAFDPHAVQNPLQGKPLPIFQDLAPFTTNTPPITHDDLCQLTHPILINFWASWCIPCIEEISSLHQISQFLEIWGINYKDTAEHSRNFLQQHGNPYRRIGSDIDGHVSIEWGVTGVPESFLIIPNGTVKWHAREGLTFSLYENDIVPLLKNI